MSSIGTLWSQAQTRLCICVIMVQKKMVVRVMVQKVVVRMVIKMVVRLVERMLG